MSFIPEHYFVNQKYCFLLLHHLLFGITFDLYNVNIEKCQQQIKVYFRELQLCNSVVILSSFQFLGTVNIKHISMPFTSGEYLFLFIRQW